MTELEEKLIGKTEELTERYIDAEKLLLDIAHYPWYKRLFCRGEIMHFLRAQLHKYNF